MNSWTITVYLSDDCRNGSFDPPICPPSGYAVKGDTITFVTKKGKPNVNIIAAADLFATELCEATRSGISYKITATPPHRKEYKIRIAGHQSGACVISDGMITVGQRPSDPMDLQEARQHGSQPPVPMLAMQARDAD